MISLIKDRNIRFAVCGAGRIGKRHIEILQQIPNVELVAVIDPVKQDFGVAHFDELDAFLHSGTEADVVCIATPNGRHAQQAIDCIRSGFHVVVEKPMAISRVDAESIIHTALQHNKLVFGVMQNRYSPPSQWLKEVVDQNILGEIYIVQCNCFWNRDDRYYKGGNWHGTRQMDGGTLYTQFSHFVDLMYWIFGDITHIDGRFSNFNHRNQIEFEDSGMVMFDFVRGGKGTLQYSTSVWDTNLESSIAVIAEKGSVKISGQYMNEVVHCHIDQYEMPELAPVNPPNDYGPYKGSAANHQWVFRNVIDVLQGEKSITTNAMEGLKVVDIIERIYAVRDASKSN